jgi:hypothetical protein
VFGHPATGRFFVLEIKGNSARVSDIQALPEEFVATRGMDARKWGDAARDLANRLLGAAEEGKAAFTVLHVTGIK